MALHVVVLAGGSGTRLWPLSREATPKHLLPLGPGGAPLLRATVERLLPLRAEIHVVTAAAQAEACRRALEGLPLEDPIIAEPVARGTGPALGLAVGCIAARDPEAIVCSVHADHDVGDDDAYRTALWAAAGWARATGLLVAVGLVPTRPATGFGYIALGEPVDVGGWVSPVAPQASATAPDGPPVGDGRPTASPTGGRRELEVAASSDPRGSIGHPVALGGPADLDDAARRLPASKATGFVEKPSADLAEEFVADGRHLWNLGLFAWSAATFDAELRAAAPTVHERLASVLAARRDGAEERAAGEYVGLPTVAIEPLVLERSRRLLAVHAAFAWSDLGSWSDLAEVFRLRGEADVRGNVAHGEAVLVGSRDCLVEARGGRLVAVVDADGLVVVDTGDVVLVVPAKSSQQVREVVAHLRASGRCDFV